MRGLRRMLAVRTAPIILAFALCFGVPMRGSASGQQMEVILVHGLWALPESLHELGDNLRSAGYKVHFITYDAPRTCKDLGEAIKRQFTKLIVTEHLEPRRTYIYGYSLGAMGIALADLDVEGIILDAPANYSELACTDLSQYVPNTPGYEVGTLYWRRNSDNQSPAVDVFARSRARTLIVGHLDDEIIPQRTVMAFANAHRFASVAWVPGGHTPLWTAVAMCIDQFVEIGKQYQISGPR